MLPLRHLLAYQKLRERIIYETCLAGFRLGSVDVGDTCISQGNSLEEKTDYSHRQERVWILSARLLLISYEILLKCLFFFTFFWILSPMHLLQSIKHCSTCWEALAVMQMLLGNPANLCCRSTKAKSLPDSSSLYLQDKCPFLIATTTQKHGMEFKVPTLPSDSPNPNPSELTCRLPETPEEKLFCSLRNTENIDFFFFLCSRF